MLDFDIERLKLRELEIKVSQPSRDLILEMRESVKKLQIQIQISRRLVAESRALREQLQLQVERLHTEILA